MLIVKRHKKSRRVSPAFEGGYLSASDVTQELIDLAA